MTGQPDPRLGASLTIGADAAIWDKLTGLEEAARAGGATLPVVAVLGETPGDAAGLHEFTIPAGAVDELAAAALAVNR